MPVQAEEEKLVDAPVIFSRHGIKMKTSACLQFKEKDYSSEHSSWERFKIMTPNSPEKALVETITAMQQKDGVRLKELSHPLFGRDPQKFGKQLPAYFSQLELIQIDDVKSYLKFDNLVVFFVQFSYKDKFYFASFSFMYDEYGNLGFLPYRSESLASDLAEDWFQSDWGPAQSQSPSYCEPLLLKEMTHNIVLEEGNHSDSVAILQLMGSNLADTNKIKEPYSGLLDQIKYMKEALASGQMEEYFNGFTEDAKKQNRDWFLAEKEERLRAQYIENFLTQEPFYVFNADPILVVYFRTKSSSVKVLYFMRQEEYRFKLVEESIGSPFDQIFKGKRFVEAAKQEKPFDSWRR